MTQQIIKGGEGSGHREHEGRPGKVGGSAPGVGTWVAKNALTGGTRKQREMLSDAINQSGVSKNHVESLKWEIVKIPGNVGAHYSIDSHTLSINERILTKRMASFLRRRGSLGGLAGVVAHEVGHVLDMAGNREYQFYKLGNVILQNVTRRKEGKYGLRWYSFTSNKEATADAYMVKLLGSEKQKDALGSLLKEHGIDWDKLYEDVRITHGIARKGGPGSGFTSEAGHRGRPGKRGGSISAGTTAASICEDCSRKQVRMLRKAIDQSGIPEKHINGLTKFYYLKRGSEKAQGLYDRNDRTLSVEPKSFQRGGGWFRRNIITHEIGHHVSFAAITESDAKKLRTLTARAIEKGRGGASPEEIAAVGLRPESFTSEQEFVADVYNSWLNASSSQKRALEDIIKPILGVGLDELFDVDPGEGDTTKNRIKRKV